MKLSLSIKVVVGIAVVLLCMGVAAYSFMRLNSVEQRQDFDLYTLVPQHAVAVFETDRMMEMLEAVDAMEDNQEGHCLHLSEHSGCLRDFFDAWLESAPHALSKQMNKVLLSYHRSGTSLDEVFYCALGTRDYDQVEAFVAHYCASSFSVKTFDYRGETIRIYPIGDGRFLSVYLTRQFMVLSFQKKLLEQVIDARHGTSLAQEEAFQRLYADKQRNVAGMLYLRMKDVPMGDGEDSVRWTLAVSDWMELDLKFAPDAIYCSGLCHDVGGGGGLADALQRQENIPMNAGEALPSSTVLYQCWSMSDKDALFPCVSKQGCLPADSSSYVAERDAEWLAWLEECAGDYALSCFFTPVDRQGQDTCAVVVVPLPDEAKARQRFYAWLHQAPRERQAPARPRFRPGYERYPRSQAYRKYLLPRNSFFARLTGIEGASLYAYACFYGDRLLLAADAFSLSAYVDAIERGEVLQDVPAFEEVAHTLAPSGTYLLMADLGRLAAWPGACRRWIPTFFWQHLDYFRPFTLALQFANAEGRVYPNMTLMCEKALGD